MNNPRVFLPVMRCLKDGITLSAKEIKRPDGSRPVVLVRKTVDTTGPMPITAYEVLTDFGTNAEAVTTHNAADKAARQFIRLVGTGKAERAVKEEIGETYD